LALATAPESYFQPNLDRLVQTIIKGILDWFEIIEKTSIDLQHPQSKGFGRSLCFQIVVSFVRLYTLKTPTLR
jgi:hypothetical protein